MTPLADRLGVHVSQWLRTLEDIAHPSDTDRAVSSSDLHQLAGPVRYGEWDGPDGRTHAFRMIQPEWVLNQIDIVHSLDDHITPDDVVVVAAPYELSLVGASIERAIEWLGAAVISVGTNNTICPVPRLLDLIHRYQVTALVCPPQLAAELAALDEAAGRCPSSSTVTTIIATQPTAPERLRRIATKWGVSAIEVFSTPSRPATATSCGFGELHILEDRVEAQLRSPSPGLIAVDGTRGELMLSIGHPESPTSVPRPTGELVEFRRPGTPCACGSNTQVVIPLGRVAGAVATPRGLVTQTDVEYCLFESPHPQGRVTSTVEGECLSVTSAVRGGAETVRRELQQLVRSRLGPAVELTLFDDEIAEVNTCTRSSR